ncbi:MAG: hypothetical protein WCU88_08810 [Elusimicrobiota bacterium]
MVDALPETGRREDYLASLGGLGIEEPVRVFEKLVAIDVLRVFERGNAWKKALRQVFAPKINLIPAALQERFFKFLGIQPQSAGKSSAALTMLLAAAAAGMLFSLGIALLGPKDFGLRPLPGVPKGAAVFALVMLGTLLHELGHSYAAAAGGIGLRPIGFSVYLFYPVFYTNVSGIEKLNLGRKMAVDCGGIIPQTAYLAALFLIGRMTQSASCLEAVRWIAWIVAFNLNPLLRTDGYWIYHDLREELRDARWMRCVHHAYLIAFVMATGYLLWQVGLRLDWIAQRVCAAVAEPRTLLTEGYKLILGLYFILMAFVGGVGRLREGTKEWAALRKEGGDIETAARTNAAEAV